MTHSTIVFWFYFFMAFAALVGLPGTILWARRILRPLLKGQEGRKYISLSDIAGRTFIYMIPGLLFLIACCVPMFYFGNLLKQEQYCLKVVRVNKGITKDSPFLLERCGCYDLDALFEQAAQPE